MKLRSLFARSVVMAVTAVLTVSMFAPVPARADNTTLTLNTCFSTAACTGGAPITEDNVSFSTGATVTMSGTLSAAPDAATSVEIDFEIESGPNDLDSGNTPATVDLKCTIPSTTTFCTVSFIANGTGTDVTRSWVAGSTPDATEAVVEILGPGGQADPDKTDAVQDNVNAGPAAQILDCDDPSTGGDTENESVANNGPTGSTHVTFKCTVTANTVGVPGIHLNGENLTTGVNDEDAGKFGDADFQANTGGDGSVNIVVPDAALNPPYTLGTAVFCFWIDSDPPPGVGNNLVNDANVQDGAGCMEPVSASEADNTTDTTAVTWVAPVVSTVDVADEDQTVILTATTTDDITIKVADQFGNGVQGQDIDLKIFSGPDRTVDTVALTCNTGVDGQCKLTINNVPKYNGVDEYCVWLDTDANHQWIPGADPGGASNDGGACNDTSGPNAEPAGLADGGDPFADRGRITWSAGVATPTELDITPETQLKTASTVASIDALVKDENGSPLAGAVVNFELTGAADPDAGDSQGSPDRSCTTIADGTCSITGTPGALGSATGFTTATPGGSTKVFAWTAAGGPADPSEGQNETTTPGVTPEIDSTDVSTVSWGAAVTTLSAAITPAIGTWGVKPTISGDLISGGAGIAGQTIAIWRSVAGAGLQKIGTTVTNGAGHYSFLDPVAPSANASYLGVFSETATYKGSSSPAVFMKVRVGIPVNATATTLSKGGTVFFNGAVLPGHPGKKAVFQIFDGNAKVWKTLASVGLNSQSKFKIGYKLNVAGMRLFRFAFATDSDHATNISSPSKKVTWV